MTASTKYKLTKQSAESFADSFKMCPLASGPRSCLDPYVVQHARAPAYVCVRVSMNNFSTKSVFMFTDGSNDDVSDCASHISNPNAYAMPRSR